MLWIGAEDPVYPANPLTDRWTKDFMSVRSYVMKDGRLFLSLMADGGIYEFEPMLVR